MIFRFSMTSAFALSLLLIVGCASKPVLISKSAATPAGINFSGDWKIRDNPDSMRLLGSRVGSDSIIRSSRRERRESRRRTPGMSAQVFLEVGENLRISQTDFGLFISYDRSVVEEYRFGENRLVSIGPIEAQRVSGWDGPAFVVETLDSDGSILFESWQLEAEDGVLARDIRIAKGDQEVFSVRQMFDRL